MIDKRRSVDKTRFRQRRKRVRGISQERNPAEVMSSLNNIPTPASRSTLAHHIATIHTTRRDHFFTLTISDILTMSHFSTEDVVAPEGISQNNRDDYQRPNQHKALTLRRRGGGIQRNIRWNNIRPNTDAQPAEPQKINPSVRINGRAWDSGFSRCAIARR